MLRATWRGLETWHGWDDPASPARQSSTLPARARRCSLGWVGDAFAAPPGSNAASGVLQGPASVASGWSPWQTLVRP